MFQNELHMTEVANSTRNTHTFFVDEGEEKNFNLAQRLDTHPLLISRKSNRPRLADLGKMDLPEINEEVSYFMEFCLQLFFFFK